MRWSRLFDDLEAQLLAGERAELLADVAEHTRAQRGQQSLADRLAADLGRPVRVRVRGAGVVDGELAELGMDWLALSVPNPARSRSRSVLVPMGAVLAVWGLSGRAEQHPGVGARRLGLRQALRAVSRDRDLVRVCDVDGGQVAGTIDRVGQDHLDLSDHPEDQPRREVAVRRRVVIPFQAVAVVATGPLSRPDG